MRDDCHTSKYDHGSFKKGVRLLTVGANAGLWQMLIPVAPFSKKKTKCVIDGSRGWTREKAEAHRETWIEKQENGETLSRNTITLHERVHLYIADRLTLLGEGQIAQATYDADVGHVAPILAYFSADRLLQSVDEETVDNFMRDLRNGKLRSRPKHAPDDWVGKPLVGSTSNKTFNALNAVMKKAVRAKKIKSNPCLGYEQPSNEPASKPKVINKEQRTALIEAAKLVAPRHAGLFAAWAYGGLRNKEGSGLGWLRVDHERGFFEVVEQLEYRKGSKHSDLKTLASSRFIPIYPELQEFLGREAKLAAYSSRFCFSTRKGAPLRHNLYRQLRLACAKAGEMTGKDFPMLRPHDLRHSFGSILLDDLVSLPRVSRLLGHANPNVTAQIYAHPMVSDEEIALAEIERTATG